jgi:hypothetical protein
MSGSRHTSLIDTIVVSRASGDGFGAGCYLAMLCCLCAGENIGDACDSRYCASTLLKSAIMLGGVGVGLYAAVTCTVPMYNAIYNSMMDDTQASKWSIQMFAGITTGMVDLMFPFAGLNIAAWSTRAIEWVALECCAPLLSPCVESVAPSIESVTSCVSSCFSSITSGISNGLSSCYGFFSQKSSLSTPLVSNDIENPAPVAPDLMDEVIIPGGPPLMRAMG